MEEGRREYRVVLGRDAGAWAQVGDAQAAVGAVGAVAASGRRVVRIVRAAVGGDAFLKTVVIPLSPVLADAVERLAAPLDAAADARAARVGADLVALVERRPRAASRRAVTLRAVRALE
jgi:hypothetical protein